MRGSRRWMNVAAAVVLPMVLTAAVADVPREMTFQGKLTGNGTDPVQLTVRFYDAPTCGNVLWSETHPNVPRPGGLFSINIGSVLGGIPDDALDYKRLDPNAAGVWLGITIGSDPNGPELTPRTKVGLVAYAAKATAAEGLVKPGTMQRALTVDSDNHVAIGSDGVSTGSLQVVAALNDWGAFRVGSTQVGQKHLAIGVNDNWRDTTIQAVRQQGSEWGSLLLNPYGGEVYYGHDGSLGLWLVGVRTNDNVGVRSGWLQVRNATSGIDDTGRLTDIVAGEITTANWWTHTKIRAEKISTPVLEIRGGSDLAEPGHVSDAGLGEKAIQPGTVVSIDPAHPGKLIVATEAYDRKVAGVISGAGGVQPGMIMKQDGHPTADGEHPIAMAGKVYVWTDADANGPIEPGDRLTTSATPGHAMKANDESRMSGAVVGKAMTELKTSKGLVLMLVQPQ